MEGGRFLLAVGADKSLLQGAPVDSDAPWKVFIRGRAKGGCKICTMFEYNRSEGRERDGGEGGREREREGGTGRER